MAGMTDNHACVAPIMPCHGKISDRVSIAVCRALDLTRLSVNALIEIKRQKGRNNRQEAAAHMIELFSVALQRMVQLVVSLGGSFYFFYPSPKKALWVLPDAASCLIASLRLEAG